MFDNIYDLLSSGEATPDELARVFTDTLNAAEKRVAEEQEAKRKAEEEAARAEAEKNALLDRKREHITDILGLYAAYLDEFYPATGEQLKDEELNDMVDPLIELIDRMATLGEAFGKNKLNVEFQFNGPKEAEKIRKAFNPFDFTHFWFN